MTDVLLADLNRNGRERLRISVTEYKGSRYADVRVYASNGAAELVPTKSGVTIRAGQIRETIEALKEAELILCVSPEAKS